MIIKEFRFLTTDDISSNRWKNWSRCYEYEWALSTLWWWTIHNTACWLDVLHKKFSKELKKYWKTHNSDYNYSEWFDNFETYDVLKKSNNKYDNVLNISMLEHLPKDEFMDWLKNIIEQSNNNVIITFDYPRVNLKKVEEYLWVKCKVEWDLLNWWNSIIKNKNYSNLNIVVLHIKNNNDNT